jgi:subtilisin family serine protease
LGTGVLIAVVDSGVDATHPDLVGQVVQGHDYADNLPEGDPDPSPEGSGPNEAHGTMVAGVIAAADNDVGIAGVAPEARILNMRACENGTCRSGPIANSIYYAVDAGADVINLSLGSPDNGDFPIEAAIDYARARNVLVVAAAGNDGANMDELPDGQIIIPAGLPHPNILAVGASTDRDRIAEFSNWGPSLDLFAPGVNIYTTAGVGLPDYVPVDGTSFSAPIVSGVAALLLSHDPGIGYAELIARMTSFTDHPGPLNGLGAEGRVNAAKVLNNRFIDTSATVFHDTAKWLADQNITEGCNPPENHMYCPIEKVTRGQMAVFFARAFGLANTNTDYFDDDDGTFYENAANMMADAGITVGCGPEQYCGDRNISRAEMAAMLARVLGLPPTNTDHFDDDSDSTFEGAINKIAEAGITQGCNPPANDEFCPDKDVNRGQMAAFIQRSLSLES